MADMASASSSVGVMTVSSSIAGDTVTPTATGTGPTPTASSSTPQVHNVQVGNGGFKFSPAELKNVSVGDIVTFEFFPPDHSVVRAEFDTACVPYEYTGENKMGFWSGTKYLGKDDPHPYFNITVNSTEPIFYYCAAPDSCKGKQMVGVINPNDTQTLDAQIESAKNADYQLKPGDEIPSEASSILSGPASTATSSSTPQSTQAHPHSLSGGAIAGIVVGAVAFLVICAALFFYVGRTKSLKEMVKRKDATVSKTAPGDAGHYGPVSPGYPPAPYSPQQYQAEYGNLPPYGQHNATDAHPSGWTSPTMHPGHMSMMSGTSQPSMSEMKPHGVQAHVAPAEMASPTPQQNTFTAELEASNKTPRS